MGKYFPSGIIQSISGSAGDFTFLSWKGMPTFKKRNRKRRKTNTPNEQRVKKIFALLSSKWMDMGFQEWAVWEDYAKTHSKISYNRTQGLIRAPRAKMAGKNAFMAVNQVLMGCGFYPIKHPTPDTTIKPSPVATDLVDLAVYNKEVRFKLWLPEDYITRCVAQIWIKRVEKKGYPYIVSTVPLSTTKNELVVDKIRVKELGNIVEKEFNELGNSKLLFQMRTVAENGLISLPSSIYKIEVKPTILLDSI